jgi:hypothetical protein
MRFKIVYQLLIFPHRGEVWCFFSFWACVYSCYIGKYYWSLYHRSQSYQTLINKTAFIKQNSALDFLIVPCNDSYEAGDSFEAISNNLKVRLRTEDDMGRCIDDDPDVSVLYCLFIELLNYLLNKLATLLTPSSYLDIVPQPSWYGWGRSC